MMAWILMNLLMIMQREHGKTDSRTWLQFLTGFLSVEGRGRANHA